MFEDASAGDLNMYYAETYVGLRVDGHTVPFYVRGVTTSRNGPKFIGHYIDWESGEDHQVVTHLSNDNLVLDTPEVGYVKTGRNWTWVSMAMTQRTTKKGITSRRLSGDVNLNDSVALSIYKRWEEVAGDIVRLHFHKKSSSLEYKGVTIGNISGSTLELKRKFRYLTRIITRIFPNLSITEVAE